MRSRVVPIGAVTGTARSGEKWCELDKRSRLMALVPKRIPHLQETTEFLGKMSFHHIGQLACNLISTQRQWPHSLRLPALRLIDYRRFQ